MDDFNAKIGKENHLMKIAGKYKIHNKTSENGNLLAQFVTRNRLFIKSTSFQHKKIHRVTWKIPGTSEVNQIDHVLVSLGHSSSVIDVTSCRGPNCDSDHYLVRVKVRERITKLQKASRLDRKKWDVERLNNDPRNQNRKEYQQTLQTKLRRGNKGEDEEDEELDVDEQLKKIEQAIKDAAEETIQEQKLTREENWFDGECAQIIEEKKRKTKNASKRNKGKYGKIPRAEKESE
jgi:hypothetical protein